MGTVTNGYDARLASQPFLVFDFRAVRSITRNSLRTPTAVAARVGFSASWGQKKTILLD